MKGWLGAFVLYGVRNKAFVVYNNNHLCCISRPQNIVSIE